MLRKQSWILLALTALILAGCGGGGGSNAVGLTGGTHSDGGGSGGNALVGHWRYIEIDDWTYQYDLFLNSDMSFSYYVYEEGDLVYVWEGTYSYDATTITFQSEGEPTHTDYILVGTDTLYLDGTEYYRVND